jgi:mono/diheme cytochrome c family protein
MEKNLMNNHSEQDVATDHVYDGIHELDNRLPPWWVWLFYITIIWSVLYMLHYHVLGTGDSSYAEYMKEYDPEWKPPATQSGFSLSYTSPIAAGEDITPRRRVEAALQAQAEAKLAAAQGKIVMPDLNFDDLIITAMQVSTPDNLEKLKTSFPDLYQRYEAGLGSDVPPAAEEAEAAEPEEIIAALTDEASLASGKTIYIANCATCHGQNGEGGIGPNMTDDYYLHGGGMNNSVRIIKNGVTAKGMISWRGILNEQQMIEVASYIETLRGTNPPNAKAPQGEKILANE